MRCPKCSRAMTANFGRTCAVCRDSAAIQDDSTGTLLSTLVVMEALSDLSSSTPDSCSSSSDFSGGGGDFGGGGASGDF